MRIVIDTNILISAVLRDRTPEAVLLFIIESPDWQWIASSSIVDEYIGVLSRPKFKLPTDILEQWQTVFDNAITIVMPTETLEFPRDPKDAKFLNCVIQGEADYFITGDRDFSEAPESVRDIIRSVNQFHEQFSSQSSE
jgi:uncharacterized protein